MVGCPLLASLWVRLVAQLGHCRVYLRQMVVTPVFGKQKNKVKLLCPYWLVCFTLFLREDGQREEWYLMDYSLWRHFATGTEVFAQLEATGVECDDQSGVDKRNVKRGLFS